MGVNNRGYLFGRLDIRRIQLCGGVFSKSFNGRADFGQCNAVYLWRVQYFREHVSGEFAYGSTNGDGKIFPVHFGGGVFWGILAGVAANIYQFWIFRAAPEAPDFANGIFLTSANLGCMAGTAFSGLFIDGLGIAYVIFGGIIFAMGSAVVIWIQSARREINPLNNA